VTALVELALEPLDEVAGVLLDPGGHRLPENADPAGRAPSLAVDDADFALAALVSLAEESLGRGERVLHAEPVEVEGRYDAEERAQERAPHRARKTQSRARRKRRRRGSLRGIGWLDRAKGLWDLESMPASPPRDPDCIFCKILDGELPSHRVMEDDETYVFMDIFPVAAGHTLVIPKSHHENLYELPVATARAIAATAQRVAVAIRRALEPHGLMVFQLNGATAGQTVFHYHMHLLPRSEGEPLALASRIPGDPARLAEQARKIATAIA